MLNGKKIKAAILAVSLYVYILTLAPAMILRLAFIIDKTVEALLLIPLALFSLVYVFYHIKKLMALESRYCYVQCLFLLHPTSRTRCFTLEPLFSCLASF